MSRRDSTRSGLAVVSAMGLVGAVGGLVWLWLAPRVKIRLDAEGGTYVDPSLRQYIDADVWYAGISLVIAIAAAVVVWRRLQQIPTAAVVALALGGGLASVALWLVGQHWGQLDRGAVRAGKNGDIVSDSLDLGARGLLGLLPVAAVATWLVLDLVAQWRRRVQEVAPDAAAEAIDPAAPSVGGDPHTSLT
jgi:hypothetical protein